MYRFNIGRFAKYDGGSLFKYNKCIGSIKLGLILRMQRINLNTTNV